MASLEQLKLKRAKEAERYKEVAKRLQLKREKAKVKEDIRNIRAAKLRGKFGFAKLKPAVPKLMKGTGTFLKTAGKIGAGLMDGLKGLDEGAKDYFGTSDRRKKNVKKKRSNEVFL